MREIFRDTPKQMKKDRLSNFELLRVVAMLMVLAIHADFYSLGRPTLDDIAVAPLNVWARIAVEVSGIVAVNVFVLISGWFGIRASVWGFCRFMFTCLFFCIGVNAVMWGCGLPCLQDENLHTIYSKIELNWFVKAYMLLYVLAPVLNAFVATASRRTQKRVLLGFFVLQTLFGWVTGSAGYFSFGYSPLSFVGLYLLARYVAVFSPLWSRGGAKTFLLAYVAITAVQTVIGFAGVQIDGMMVVDRLIAYNNPLVIAASLALLLCFRELHLRSRLVNWLGGSSFAVFLLHTHPALFGLYKQAVVWICNIYSGGVFWLLISTFIVLVYAFAVLVDQVRIWLWRVVEKCVRSSMLKA